MACHHRNGKIVGTCWMIIRGGGCVVGQVSGTSNFTIKNEIFDLHRLTARES